MQVEADREPPAAEEVSAAGKDTQQEIEPFPMTPTKDTALTKVGAASESLCLFTQTLAPVRRVPRQCVCTTSHLAHERHLLCSAMFCTLTLRRRLRLGR